MKRFLLFFTSFIFLSFTGLTQSGDRQFINYEYDNGWNFGINTGGTWQRKEAFIKYNDTSFTKPYAGFSGGFTFGKSIYEEEGKFFAFDLRFRYLRGKNYGWVAKLDTIPSDHFQYKPNDISAHRNYKMDLNEFSLEGVLTLNRLRERTGIILYGFGGLGIIDYRVKSDFLDGNSEYNYPFLSSSNTDIANASIIKGNSDLDFESNAINENGLVVEGDQLQFMPSLGLGLGYQLNDWISVGLEHKITYAFHNNLDGLSSDLKNDNYHYTAFKLGINLFGEGQSNGGTSYNHQDYSTEQTISGNTSQTITDNTNTQQDNNIITIPQGNPPLVNIINPAHSNTIVHNSAYHLIAKVYYVTSAQNIELLHNGYSITNFSFNSNTNELKANLALSPGENIIEITGTNDYGSDHDEREIIYEVPQITEIPPVVVINYPHNSPYDSENKEIVITAKVLNIATAQQIEFKVNGISHSNFSFNNITDVFTSSILLEEGPNQIIITATNNAGTASDSKLINYIKETPPTVQITSPSSSPATVGTPLINISGKVLNVPSKNNITVRHNGYNVSNFMYDINSKVVAFNVNLIHGQNIVEIAAFNSAGTASDFTKIIYQTPELTSPPIVSYVQPSSAPYQVQVSNVTIIAKVLNVSSKNQTSVGFNGSNISGYSFNGVTKLLTVNLNLNEGSNVLKISGTNQAGTDVEELNIIYNIPQQIEMPKITILDPAVNPYNTANNAHLINGLIEHVEIASNANATINNQPISNFTFDPNTDKFVCDVVLNEGANIFEVDAVNSAGTASKATTLIYVPIECSKPVINLTAPNNWQTNTTNSKGYIEMQIINEQSLVFKVNGEDVPSYNYDNGKFSSFLHLIEGMNSYEVIATNECGSTIQKVAIVYEKEIPCNEPVINFIRPLGTGVSIPVTTTTKYHLSFNVLEVSSKAEIVLMLNGNTMPFNFDPSSGEVQSNVMLQTGMNTFLVKVKNNCGEASKSAKIELEEPILPPKVKLTQPKSFPHQTQNQQVTVSGKITNVTNQNDIHVYLDGHPIGFSFNAVTGFITVLTNLELGGNQLIVEAENEAGSDQANAELIRLGIPPIIHLTNRSETTTAKAPEYIQVNSRVSIIGYITNFEDVDFKATLNGSPFNFIYNSSNGTFRGIVNINDGELLKFTIKASNEWGQDVQLLFLSKEAINNSNSNGNSGSSSGNSKNNASNNTNSKTTGPSDQKQQQVNNEHQKMINKANMYYNSKRWSDAKSYYNKALKLKPNDSFSKSRISTIENKLKLIEENKVKTNIINKSNSNKSNSTKSTNSTKSSNATSPKNSNTNNPIKSNSDTKAVKKDGGKN